MGSDGTADRVDLCGRQMVLAMIEDLTSCGYFAAVVELGRVTQAAPLDYLAVWQNESGNRATAHNPNGHASGVFQAMPATLKLLGYPGTHEDFRRLDAATQVRDWATRYYRPYTGRLVSAAAVYVATFLPADLTLAGDPSAVLVAQNGRRGWAYGPNRGFDVDRDGRIVVGELTAAIHRACRGARWDAIVAELQRTCA